MYGKKKKVGFAKALTTVLRRVFRARNVIIISEHKVGHVPLSGTMQVLLLVGSLGFFSGMSYITGSYMTARGAIKERDQKIVVSTIESTRTNEEMGLLKRDLMRLSQNGKELSDYTKFIIGQHARPAAAAAAPAPAENTLADTLFGQSNEKLMQRVTFLESRIDKIKDENDRLVTAIRERTDKKISYLEDIIAMTGLDATHLESMQHSAAPLADTAAAAPAAGAAKKDRNGHTDQGGPFIPYDASSFNDSDRELLENVDRLVMLHDIVEQLPLSIPISEAHEASPFGKRLDPINGRWSLHPGVDLAGPSGSHIYSASAGKITFAGHKVAYGNSVDIEHGFGIVTRYGHMSRVLVHQGDIVKKHQLIGIQGSTGRSTGPHLHYEVRINDRAVNPAKFLQAGGQYVLKN